MRWTGEYEEDFDNRASHYDDDGNYDEGDYGDYLYHDDDLYHHNRHNDEDHINCEQTKERGDASP